VQVRTAAGDLVLAQVPTSDVEHLAAGDPVSITLRPSAALAIARG
jgi:hypothetical protein